MMLKYIIPLVPSLFILAPEQNDVPKLPADVAAEYRKINTPMDYNQHVKPILSDKCFACHGPDKAKQKAGLRLDQSTAAYAFLPESPGKVAIAPGKLAKSEVFHRIISADPEYKMPTPQSHLDLSAKEKAYLIKWIEEGAVYQPHWAFVKPTKKPVPNIPASLNGVNPIDHFVFAQLLQNNLQPSKQATKELLLRRVSMDLTGLPPTLEEIDAFVQDSSPNAYEKQVDRLLQSKHYGERMAADWLDLARFADTHGYTVDRLRDMSPYRDWVINAFNINMPYNTFIHQQLAGDLLPNPTRDMLIATAFNRNHQQNMEGGIVELEYQTEYVMDRTNTMGDAFMALSVGCARCHDHKYDPVSQKNYYEMFSFFNNVAEAGQIAWNDDLPTPTLLLPTEQQEQIILAMKGKIVEAEKQTSLQKASVVEGFNTWINNGSYQTLANEIIPQKGLNAFFELDGNLVNKIDTAQKGEMKHEAGAGGDKPVFSSGRGAQVIALNGDVYLDLSPTGVFSSAEPFTIGMWVWIPKDMKEGVIFHKNEGERLYNFKGFHVYLKNNRLEILMAHSAPSNAIIKLSETEVPREKWIQLSLTYDGSSKASGFNLHQNGDQLPMTVVIDKLYKDILFNRKKEPGLQIGGWWRGVGFKGGRVDDVAVYNRLLTTFELGILANKNSWGQLKEKTKEQLSTTEKDLLADYYTMAVAPSVQASLEALKKLRRSLNDSLAKVKQLMVMEEMAIPKKTTILNRGQYDQPGTQVFPNTPADIFPFPASYPKNRLGLAKWLTNENHPLTSRVVVNRLWQQFFGVGIVKTSEDFGNQGELPSNPALLDWLAVELQESGWDLKKMVKLMVMSSTYKQDSYASPSLREMDPENRLLARGPANRLTAEMMRDNVLTASGLINKKIGGPSIRPYQPAGLWEINSSTYVADSTDAVYRRSLYIIAKRTVPNPTMATFDASERSSCLSRRQKTNTPLQSLVLLNDPTYIEASKVLGEAMSRETDQDIAITKTYRKLTGRNPSPKELNILKALYKQELDKFRMNPEKTKGWLSAGLYKFNAQVDKPLVAANAVVASTIMNSDASITKR